MLTQYWVPSDQEPFADYWVNPEKLTADVFEGKDFHLANVSCPFFFDGVRYVPKILEVAKRARSFGVEVQIGIIVRDQNINRVQQERVRGMHTTPIAQEYYYDTLIPSGFDVHFIDHEAFFLHKQHYLRWLEKILGFPIAWDSPDLMKFITDDANGKYVHPIKTHWLDEVIHAGCMPTRSSRMGNSNTVDK